MRHDKAPGEDYEMHPWQRRIERLEAWWHKKAGELLTRIRSDEDSKVADRAELKTLEREYESACDVSSTLRYVSCGEPRLLFRRRCGGGCAIDFEVSASGPGGMSYLSLTEVRDVGPKEQKSNHIFSYLDKAQARRVAYALLSAAEAETEED